MQERGLLGEEDLCGSSHLFQLARAEGYGLAFVFKEAVDDVTNVRVLQFAL